MSQNKKDIFNYPGDIILRATQLDMLEFYKDEDYIQLDTEDNPKLKNVVIMNISSETLEETSIIIEKLNSKTDEITGLILERVSKDFLKINSLDKLDDHEEDFIEYINNLEDNSQISVSISGVRKSDKKKFSSSVSFRSNGGFDEIIKALPLLTDRTYFNKQVRKLLK